MPLDLSPAIAHNLLIFALFGILVSELVLVTGRMSPARLRLLTSIDMWNGVTALFILIVGFSRVSLGTKGWAYYANNYFFWAKIGVFLLIAAISIWPAMKFMGWRTQFENTGLAPEPAAIAPVKRILWLETALFGLIPAFAAAAAVALGYGEG